MNKDNIDFVIYHNPCCDGFGPAYVAWKYLPTKFPNKKVTYYPDNYGNVAPIVKDKNILISDFSYPENVINTMIKESKSFLIIDHHVTSEQNLENIPNKYKIFDKSNSGCVLTWKYFFPNEPIPTMLLYIEDRDLWKKQLPCN